MGVKADFGTYTDAIAESPQLNALAAFAKPRRKASG